MRVTLHSAVITTPAFFIQDRVARKQDVAVVVWLSAWLRCGGCGGVVKRQQEHKGLVVKSSRDDYEVHVCEIRDGQLILQARVGGGVHP
ncbi:hypothetical protein O3P69_018884 [Scylla paramamosain]|uniref:Uncharacterized protein n=1 Tax=Scylla paramamosain TaxID=85552 RepID=A0AAW0ST79_SCYPA